jgi:hypothetical protein
MEHIMATLKRTKQSKVDDKERRKEEQRRTIGRIELGNGAENA